MNELIVTLLEAVITAAVPVCTAFIVQFLRKKTAQAVAQTDNIKIKELMERVSDAVTTAVTYTNQTYVDAVRKKGVLNAEAQREAMEKSLEKTYLLLSEVAVESLNEIYGSAEEYLTSRIEAEVRKQKMAAPQLTDGKEAAE